MADDLYHFALASDWLDAQRSGIYTGSTIGRTVEEEGLRFAHGGRRITWSRGSKTVKAAGIL